MRVIAVWLAVGGLVGLALGRVMHGTPSSRATVDPRVLTDTADGRTAHVLVRLRGQANVSAAVAGAPTRAAQGASAVAALRRAADGQVGVEAELRRLGAPFRAFWVVNAIAVDAGRDVVDALAARPDVVAVEADRAFRGYALESGHRASAAARGVEWNIQKIGAPAVWALGYTGQGLVYANADTGVAWEAPALKSRYRGWDGTTAKHDYSWWDAVHGDISGNGSNPCGFDTKTPCDDDGHGTHTMGTAVGDDGAGNQIGVAPGAKWIACRNMDEAVGRPSTYIECLQFFLAPTDLNGANPDPSKRPNAIGNSYACPPDEGCSAASLQAAVDNVRAAGIFMAVAAGNEGGGGCATVVYPPGTYDSSTSVGATDPGDQIAFFSSRGPVTADGSGRLKPDLVAPGVGVRSSSSSGYAFGSGTSIAAPHVGGAVLLLWSAFPQLRGNVDATEHLLEQSAAHLTTGDGCGGDTTSTVPNNTFGFGRLDVAAAFRAQDVASPPGLSVKDVRVAEGNSGRTTAVFPVTLTRVSSRSVTVHFATRGGKATPGVDFVAVSGTLTFAPGEASKSIAVPVIGDRQREPDETFSVELSGAVNARVLRARAVGTIRNDDVDRTKPVLARFTVAVRPGVPGAVATARFRLSEPASVSCELDRRAGSGWRQLGVIRRIEPSGTSSLRLPFVLAKGAYRLRCLPRDQAGNTGRRVALRFAVAS